MTAPAQVGGLLIIERILRDRAGIWRQIADERALIPLIKHMLISSVVSLALYGAVLGASFGPLQALSSLFKLPLLFLATLAICLPTLYLFNLVFGARLSMVQAVALIMVAITVISVLTLAFAPISLFFLITAQSYSFFKLLNVSILFLTALVGLRFLTAGMQALNDLGAEAAAARAWQAAKAEAAAANATVPASPAELAAEQEQTPQPVPALAAVGAPAAVHATVPNGAVTAAPLPPQIPAARTSVRAPGSAAAAAHPAAGQRPASMTLLYIWILLFGFVGTQLAWTLRPFFGSPGEPFGLFRNIGGTFYADIFRTIGHLVGG
jgi:hypothetical protein